MSGQAEGIAIVGGGFSGAMLAARLAERGVTSTIVNRTADFGLGVAYSTPFDGHLLNVRSSRMSALADRPAHFVDWLKAHHPDSADPDRFAPRRVFGLYVQDRLRTVETAHPGTIRRVVAEVAQIAADGVQLADGSVIAARAVVLATGNPAPRTAEAGASPRVIADPWATGALDRIGADDDVLIVGTGLTMVDMLLMLDGRGWTGRATALSRRGLMPRVHGERPDPPRQPTETLLSGPLSLRLNEARRLSRGGGWREVMEGLRPITAELWMQADLATRRRIVRHLRPFWDVHRHRLATTIGVTMDRLTAESRLTIVTGRVRAITADDRGVRLDWRARRGEAPPLTAPWLIDCTGPGHAADADPLTAPLIHSGRARLDPLRLGLDLDPLGRVLDREGRPASTLFVLGPPARAAFWETIAVPDIRKRIEDVAGALRA
ncbi:FAD/NAD(P)-binding protein [Brevundimonas aurifodinae]|uniref:FAD/NAD(P)-binding protein n=2 Tax=Brevundimonas TaxID=41275 RepID=A0ABV1NR72_9CAUL|nr:MAG: FAD-dependent oxidoreductase [Brevundimonas sp. 12-68-7]OYX35031.1 MAG: FAD-dependent oxidoreductase [Brevundimonas subvibrioides]